MSRIREKTNVEICKENNIPLLLTNAVDESVTKHKIRAALQIIAKVMTSTLGPDGSTTILQNMDTFHLVTKDGLDVINKMHFEDEIAKTVLDLVKTISSSQVLTVGDGSTSAIVVANALYQEITNNDSEIFKKISPKIVVDILNYLSDYLLSELKKEALPISADMHEIEHIAAVAMNNDEAIGKLMRDIYLKIGAYGFVIPDSKDKYDTDYVEFKKGIYWDRGYISHEFGERFDSNKVVYENPKVFITNGTISVEDIDTYLNPLIGEICGRANESLIIVANYITDEAKNFFANVRQLYKTGKPELQFTVVDIDQVTSTSVNKLKDLALLCGCEIFNKSLYTAADVAGRLMTNYNKEDKQKFIGTALKATVTKQKTEIICDDSLLNDLSITNKNNEIAKLKEELDILNKKSSLTTEEITQLYDYKSRVSNLENLNAIFHVGGKTMQERESRERLVEDAIFASKSALLNGYVVGGNIMIPKILEKNKAALSEILNDKYSYLNLGNEYYTKVINIIEDSFLESYKSVLQNSYVLNDDQINDILQIVLKEDKFYNLKKHVFETFKETTIINSVDTDVQIMSSCISLIGLLATSNQIITINCNITDQVSR